MRFIAPLPSLCLCPPSLQEALKAEREAENAIDNLKEIKESIAQVYPNPHST
jgi:hypothetical protein